MVFLWSLRTSKSPQVSKIFLSILAILNNAIVWMVSIRPPTSKSSSPFISLLVTVPNTPIKIGIIVTFVFHFFYSLALILLFIFVSVLFCGQPVQHSREFCNFSFLLITIRSGLLSKIRGSVYMSKSHKRLYVSFSRTAAVLCI